MKKKSSTWIIAGTNVNVFNSDHLSILRFKENRILFDEGFFKPYNDHILIGIDGYITPVNKNYNKYKEHSQHKLVGELFINNSEDFHSHLKGIFNILIIDKKTAKINIYNDHFGLSKYFFTSLDNSSRIISNNYNTLIKSKTSVNLNPQNAIIFQLTNHFIDGISLYDDVYYSKPANHISIDSGIIIKQYFNSVQYFYSKSSKNMDDVQQTFSDSIFNSIDYHKPKDINLTLTGGLDNRLTLSLLKKTNKEITGITYGHANSLDVIKAKDIASKVSIKHKHFSVEPDAEWFRQYVKKINSEENYLINMHRAHRYATFEKFADNQSILFGGYAGGEIIRNYYPDGIHISKFIHSYLSETNVDKRIELLKQILELKEIKRESYDIDYLISFFEQLSYSSDNVILNKFNLTFDLVLPLQHAQDINVSNQFFKQSIPVYFDTDIIDTLFKSKYNFVTNNKRYFQNKALISFIGPYASCKIIHDNNKILANIPLLKKGSYSPAELVNDSLMKLFVKRLIRMYTKKEIANHAPVFSLGKWMEDYVTSEYQNIKSNDMMNSIFNIDSIYHNTISKAKLSPAESTWRPMTNLISIKNILSKG